MSAVPSLAFTGCVVLAEFNRAGIGGRGLLFPRMDVCITQLTLTSDRKLGFVSKDVIPALPQ